MKVGRLRVRDFAASYFSPALGAKARLVLLTLLISGCGQATSPVASQTAKRADGMTAAELETTVNRSSKVFAAEKNSAADRTIAVQSADPVQTSDLITEDQNVAGRKAEQKAQLETSLDPARKYLIIHADDAGLCRSVNRATIDAMERGLVSSASIMVPCPAFEEFATYAREHPERDFGIHLTLNAEFPEYPWKPILPAEEVPGLVNGNGTFWASETETAANARADEVERELMAQIERAKSLGVKFSHLDTHMGTLLTRVDFLEVYVNLGIKYDVPILFVRQPEMLQKFRPAAGIVGKADGALRALHSHQLPLLDDVFMHYVSDSLNAKRDHYFEMLRGLKPGAYEVLVHCAYPEADIYSFTSSAGLRDGDRQIFMEPETRREIERLGIQIVTWKEYRQLATVKN